MKLWLAGACLLAGCAGQPHPLTPSDRAMCHLELLTDYAAGIPDAAIYAALTGHPEELGAYLLAQKVSPEGIVSFLNEWKACAAP